MKGLIIDWMDGRHLQFETFEEAKIEFDKMLEDKTLELDIELFRLVDSLSNIKN